MAHCLEHGVYFNFFSRGAQCPCAYWHIKLAMPANCRLSKDLLTIARWAKEDGPVSRLQSAGPRGRSSYGGDGRTYELPVSKLLSSLHKKKSYRLVHVDGLLHAFSGTESVTVPVCVRAPRQNSTSASLRGHPSNS